MLKVLVIGVHNFWAKLIVVIFIIVGYGSVLAVSADDVRMVNTVDKNRCKFVEQDTCSTVRSNPYGRCQAWHKRRAAQLSANTFSIVSYDLSGGFGRSTVVADYYHCRSASAPSAEPSKSVRGSGTGFFVSDSGHIVTNYHVVSNATEILASKVSGDTISAEIEKIDIANDLALLRADTKSVPLAVGRSGDLKKGSSVFTLGYPMPDLQGNEQKATFGRINSLTGLFGTYHLFQIDVDLQAGNSGGPLLDDHGNVIGVVTGSLSDSFVFGATGSIPQNVNYAIKSDYLVPILSELSARPKASHGGRQPEMADLIERIQGSVVFLEVQRSPD